MVQDGVNFYQKNKKNSSSSSDWQLWVVLVKNFKSFYQNEIKSPKNNMSFYYFFLLRGGWLVGQILNRKFIFIFLTLPLENNHFLLIFGHGPHAKQNVYKEYLFFIPHSKASSLQFSFDIFDFRCRISWCSFRITKAYGKVRLCEFPFVLLFWI